jgi:AcrR family transcriptional regulator
MVTEARTKPRTRPSRTKYPEEGGKRARTRAALVEAAAALIAERGMQELSLEAVTERAGMSRGAYYGNFKDRDELLMAVLESRWKPVKPVFKAGGSLSEQMHILAQAVIASVPARQAMAVRALEFQLYALKHPAMRARLAQYSAEAYDHAQAALLDVVPESALPMPAPIFVRVLHCLMDGLLFERFQIPQEITDEVIEAAFEALARQGFHA